MATLSLGSKVQYSADPDSEYLARALNVPPQPSYATVALGTGIQAAYGVGSANGTARESIDITTTEGAAMSDAYAMHIGSAQAYAGILAIAFHNDNPNLYTVPALVQVSPTIAPTFVYGIGLSAVHTESIIPLPKMSVRYMTFIDAGGATGTNFNRMVTIHRAGDGSAWRWRMAGVADPS